MKYEALKNFQDIHLTLIALVIFFVVFVAMTLWVFRRSRKTFYDKMATLPLNEEINYEQR